MDRLITSRPRLARLGKLKLKEVIIMADIKGLFFVEKLSLGMEYKDVEKAWLASGLSIKRGKSAKDNIVHSWIAGEVTKENLVDWLKANGTDNDVKQSSYYKNRLEDFELIAKSLGKAKKQA